ncbi:uncharacterized protein [Maniola hyperantus]|uniref:uncharacterized protein n=1 Tax=Aphantopus hyperantus TaxID=2795564 RepID=UPI00374950C1
MPEQTLELGNRTARLISPLYSRDLAIYGCFLFTYTMYTYTNHIVDGRMVGIRVYQKPEYLDLEDLVKYSDEAKKEYILFENWGELEWWTDYEEEIRLKHLNDNFQIIIEGICVDGPRRISVRFVDILLGSLYCSATTTAGPTTSTSTTVSITMSQRPTTTTLSPPTKERPRGISDSLSCDFDDNDLCGWTNDTKAFGRWIRGIYSYSSSQLEVVMPEHTEQLSNRTARLISPLYSRDLEGNGCFYFSYQKCQCSYKYFNSDAMPTGLRVYQKPEYLALEDLVASSDETKKDYILYEIWEELEMWDWYWKELTLRHFDDNFQIIIEGIIVEGDRHIIVDEVEIRQGSECSETTTAASTTSTSTTTSTTTKSPRPTTTTLPLPTTATFPRLTTPKLPQPTTTLSPPTTTTISPPTSTQRQQGRTEIGSRDVQLISIIVILGILVLTFVFILMAVLVRQHGTYRLNVLTANIVGTSSRDVEHETKSEARYSTKDGDEVIIHCNEATKL